MNKLDLEDTTRRFHNVYEQVAKEYGYKTREDTKELDFNSPNGMTMLKTVETITTPYLEEIERLKGNIEIISDDLGNIGYMLGLEEGSCYEDVLEKIRKLQQKENIIKEVREYIKEHIRIDYDCPNHMEMLLEEYKELLEILDKGE